MTDSHQPYGHFPPAGGGINGPGYGQPYSAPNQPLVTIGDITCTQSHVITPSGNFPTAGAQWSVTNMSITTERMSQTGLVLALVGFSSSVR